MQTKKSYDPGTVGEIISEGRGRFLVESFKKRGEFYAVDLFVGTCTCPDYQFRGRNCKHQAAASFRSFMSALKIARSLTVAQLEKQAARTDLRPEQAEAVRIVLKGYEAARGLVEDAQSEVIRRQYCRV